MPKSQSLISLRNVVLAIALFAFFKHLFEKAKRFVLLRFLLGLETKKSRYSFQHGGELIARTLVAHGIKFLFTTCKVQDHPLIQSCSNLKILVIRFENDSSALAAADVVFRISGIPVVVFLPNSLGITNSIGAILNCLKAQSSAIIISENVPYLMKGMGVRQEVHQVNLLTRFVKYSRLVTSVRDVVPFFEEGIQNAQTGIFGPVFFSVHKDVFYPQLQMIEEYRQIIKLDQKDLGFIRHTINRFYLANVYATDSVNVRAPKPLKAPHTKSVEFLVKKTLQILKRADRPLLLIGSQGMPKHTEVSELQSALVALGVPVFLFGTAKGLLGDESPLVHTKGFQEAVQNSDLLILAGVVQDYALHYGQYISDKTFVISINKSKLDMLLNCSPTLCILSDPFLFLKNLGASAKFAQQQSLRWQGWSKTIVSYSQQYQRSLSVWKSTRLETAICTVLLTLNEIATNCHIISNGEWTELQSAVFSAKLPYGWMEPGPFGYDAIAAGFSIGSQLLFPDREVWVLDSSANPVNALREIPSLIANQMPVVFVLFYERSTNVSLRPHPADPCISYFPIKSDEECGSILVQAESEYKKGKIVIVDYFY